MSVKEEEAAGKTSWNTGQWRGWQAFATVSPHILTGVAGSKSQLHFQCSFLLTCTLGSDRKTTKPAPPGFVQLWQALGSK